MELAPLFAALALTVGADDAPTAETIGHSVRGRPIRALRLGDPLSERRLLVVGCIHGNECAGMAIVRRLSRSLGRGATFDLWLVPNLNPDGLRLGVRQNARGVDLNRNFPAGWQPIGTPWYWEYSGPRPLSEPETRVARRFLLRIEPDVTIWYHQPQALVRTGGPNNRAARRYARLVGLPFRRLPVPPGAATRWQLRRFPDTSAFVVELPPGPLSWRAKTRHARAVLRLGETITTSDTAVTAAAVLRQAF
jgi:protein MpaA